VDYNSHKIFDKKLMRAGVTCPYVGIWALEDGTYIILYNEDDAGFERIHIPKGHLFIMSGDCKHGGYDYECNNVRIHFYFESIDMFTSDNNKTGWLIFDKIHGWRFPKK